MYKKMFSIILSIFCCIFISACDRTQSAQDAYKETNGQEKTNEQKETNGQEEFDLEKSEKSAYEPLWDTLSNNYLYEDEVMVWSDMETIDDIKVKVLDAFYSDSAQAGGEYFGTSENLKALFQDSSKTINTTYLFIKVEIENTSEKNVQYCTANITPFACKIGKKDSEICFLDTALEQVFDASEDEGGDYYYILFLQPKEKRTFTVCCIVLEDELTENIDNIYINPGKGVANFDVENRAGFINGNFKLLHIPVRKFKEETSAYQQ